MQHGDNMVESILASAKWGNIDLFAKSAHLPPVSRRANIDATLATYTL